MSQDRIIIWKKKRPSKRDIGIIASDYFGEIAEVRWEDDRYFCKVVGMTSYPLKNIPAAIEMFPVGQVGGVPIGERSIEIWLNKSYMYIITRLQDEITNAMAEGLATVFTRFYQAEREAD